MKTILRWVRGWFVRRRSPVVKRHPLDAYWQPLTEAEAEEMRQDDWQPRRHSESRERWIDRARERPRW